MEKRYNIFFIVAISTLMILVDVGTFTNHTIAALNSVTDNVRNKAQATQDNIISPEKAMGVAINNLQRTEDGYELSHPRHIMTFLSDGVSFKPLHGGPDWQWRLEYIGTESTPLTYINRKTVMPQSSEPGVISYKRGGIVEQYLAKANTVEQQFVITEQLPLKGSDLVIEGAVESAGTLESGKDGWQWNDKNGVVSLGDVFVYDAEGNELPATMNVTVSGTRIVVDGTALAKATYPVTIDPEIGTNDFRISNMGSDGDPNLDAVNPSVAFNPTNNEYLVVWSGKHDIGTLRDSGFEIFGQRIDATTGAEIGTNDFRISDMGTDADTSFDAFLPKVAFNPTNNEYLVVWIGDENIGTLGDDEFEIFGQRINAATGDEIGTNDFRISDMGTDGDTGFFALNPAVTFNPTSNEYLVVWHGSDNTGALVSFEAEVFGQRINAATGEEVGANDFRISDMGTDGDTSFAAQFPAVSFNSTNNQYLVVWKGEDDTETLVNGEFEIFGQRIDAITGTEIGANDFRISDMGTNGDGNFEARFPAVAYSPTNNEYLVVWNGDDNIGTLVDDEFEIFGQRINAATGEEVGANDFRISDMGTDSDISFGGQFPTLSYNLTNNEYLVVWNGDDDTNPLVDDELEIFGQRIDAATGAELGANDFRISDMGTDGDTSFFASQPAVDFNPTNNQYLVVWNGDDDTGALVDDEFEIFGQLLSVKPGPSILSITADDPDDGDTVYSDSDIITVIFSEETNEPSVASKVEIDSIFTFSDSLGIDYTGTWSNASTLVIFITNSIGATPPEIGVFTLTVKESSNLKNVEETSLPSTATSPALVGDFGTLEGPSILSVTADDPDDGDAVYSDGDTITVLFSGATNEVPITTKAELDNLFIFSQILGIDYIGSWTDTSTLVIIIVDSNGATPPAVGELTLTIKESGNLTNAAGTSFVSTGTSPALAGDFGLPVVLPTPTATPEPTFTPITTPTPTPTAEPTPTPAPTLEPTPTPTPTPIDESKLTANPDSFGSSLIPKDVVITVLDKEGNPQAGVRVDATAKGRTVSVRPLSADTRTDGTARFKVRFGFLETNGEVVFSTEDKSVSVTQE